MGNDLRKKRRMLVVFLALLLLRFVIRLKARTIATVVFSFEKETTFERGRRESA